MCGLVGGVDRGLDYLMTSAPLPASSYRHLHFTGYKTHTLEQTHTPGGPVQLSPLGQPDLGRVMDTV